MTSAGYLLGGRYRLGERIGAGGFSEVWRARDIVLDRQVAVKLLDARYARDAEAVTRFRGEGRNAGCLTHPNIARVYDLAEPDPDSAQYLVMELVDGPSLAGLLAAGPVCPQRCLEIVAHAAAGLQAAHAAGLVHRDIKPGNLLIGQDGTVKVADFGISHAVDSAPLTCTGIVVGSAGYVAPERAAGARATPATDLYALGVVAYECLTGAPPFAGTGLEVALAHVNLPFPPLPADVPGEVAELVARLTDKDPARRPADAGEVARWAGELRARLASGAPGRTDAAGAAAAGSAAGDDVTRAGAVLRGRASGRRHGCGRRGGRQLGGGLAGGLRRLAASGLLAFAARGTAAGGPATGHRPSGPVQPGWRAPLAGAAVVTALAGVAIAGGMAAFSPGRADDLQAGIQPAVSAEMAAGVRAGDLVGLPVRDAVHRLRHLGFRVEIRWLPTRAQRPGRVVSVSPRGVRSAGSRVTVVGAVSPRRSAQLAAAASGTRSGQAGAVGGPVTRHGQGRGRGSARGGRGGPGNGQGPQRESG